MVAGGAKQMALDHDWLFPKIGNRLWLEKPPLLHWLVVVSAKLFGGFSETAVAVAFCSRRFGRRRCDDNAKPPLVWSARGHFHGAAANNHGLLHHLCPSGRGGDVAGFHCRARAVCFCALALHRWCVAATTSATGAAVLGTRRSEQYGQGPGIWSGAHSRSVRGLLDLEARPRRVAKDDFMAWLGAWPGHRTRLAGDCRNLRSRGTRALARGNRAPRGRLDRLRTTMVVLPDHDSVAAPALDAGAFVRGRTFLRAGLATPGFAGQIHLVLGDCSHRGALALPWQTSSLHHQLSLRLQPALRAWSSALRNSFCGGQRGRRDRGNLLCPRAHSAGVRSIARRPRLSSLRPQLPFAGDSAGGDVRPGNRPTHILCRSSAGRYLERG